MFNLNDEKLFSPPVKLYGFPENDAPAVHSCTWRLEKELETRWIGTDLSPLRAYCRLHNRVALLMSRKQGHYTRTTCMFVDTNGTVSDSPYKNVEFIQREVGNGMAVYALFTCTVRQLGHILKEHNHEVLWDPTDELSLAIASSAQLDSNDWEATFARAVTLAEHGHDAMLWRLYCLPEGMPWRLCYDTDKIQYTQLLQRRVTKADIQLRTRVKELPEIATVLYQQNKRMYNAVTGSLVRHKNA